MKQNVTILLFLILMVCNANAQVTGSDTPWSFDLEATPPMSDIILPPINSDSLLLEDQHTSYPLRYAVYRSVNTNIYDVNYIEHALGRIWRVRLESSGAYSLGVYFGKFQLAEGARLYMYDDAKNIFSEAYTCANNKQSGSFALQECKGNHIIIELNEPYNISGENHLFIESISHAYKNVYNGLLFPSGNIRSKSTEEPTGITCPLGETFRQERHAVCKLTFKVNDFAYFCTGTLLNTTKQDGTPYLLTANHCFDNNETAQTMVAYFNDEKEDCNGSYAEIHSISGAELVATNKETDFTLVKLSSVPPPECKAYYAGWSRDTSISSGVSIIHHPDGTHKRIATDNEPPVTNPGITSFGDYVSQPYSLWITSWDFGATEGGSSGCPLFDDNKRVIGYLHAGSNTYDFFKRFATAWDYGSSDSTKLQPWLDPDNTGAAFLDGFVYESVTETDFSVDENNRCIEEDIKLNDKTLFAPTSWEWQIEPETFSFQGGTDNYSQNPIVRFYSTTAYDITLITSNEFGTDTLVKPGFISFNPNDADACASIANNPLGARFDEVYYNALEKRIYFNAGNAETDKIYISDISGRKVKSITPISSNYIDVSDLSPEVYIFYFVKGSESFSSKVIIK